MARALQLERCTFVGTPEQIRATLEAILGMRSAAVRIMESNFVVCEKPLTQQQIERALEVTPRKAR